ncbi:hypothetical protein [Duganella radicis]|uniref:Uncharacterized protein n=1 Tax=Duganella radicis TaxID=551988 RepID=A0A6L6PN08_9BURK|nr:hypothetical protein [Duganella radicis]MTV40343.1 hypothetical protein [Duganella radicis]
MKKYLCAGLLTACLSAPAFAATSKFIPQSPDEPLHRRTVVLCVALIIGLQAYKHHPRIERRQHPD